MEVLIFRNAEEASTAAARRVIDVVREKPSAVLGLATGSSPKGLYREVARLHRERGVSFKGVRFFGLDEYVGLTPTHPACYHVYVREHLTTHLDVPDTQVDVPRGYADDLARECARYEDAIREAGGIDLQVLGIGTDGHIAFNEPSSSLGSRTRVRVLSEQTVRDNAIHFPPGERVPNTVVTMGVGTILESRHLMMLAFGRSKRDIIAQALEGPVTAMVPASSLQLHPQVSVYLDDEAAAGLTLREYHLRRGGEKA